MKNTSFTRFWRRVSFSFYSSKQQGGKKNPLYLDFDYDELDISFLLAITLEVDTICGQKHEN